MNKEDKIIKNKPLLDEEIRKRLIAYLKKRKKMREQSSTGTGAGVTGGQGEGVATKYAFAPTGKGNNKSTSMMVKQGYKKIPDSVRFKAKTFDIEKWGEGAVNEGSYHQFKNEVKHRTSSEQIHKAVKQIKQKIQQINKLLDYTERMKMELSENEAGLQYLSITNKALERISDMVGELNKKLKNLNK